MGAMTITGTVTYKVLVLGEHRVGKTALVRRYSKPAEGFSHSLLPTIGIDYITVYETVDGLKLKVQLWDTVGQERFRTMTRLYYRGAKGILLIYDVTSRDTFAKVADWMQDLRQHSLDNEVLFLVGNKIDLTQERCVTEEEGRQLALRFGVKHFETSALTGDGVTNAFQQLMVNMKDANNPFEVGNVHLIDGDEWEELFSKNPVTHNRSPRRQEQNSATSEKKPRKVTLDGKQNENNDVQEQRGRCCF